MSIIHCRAGRLGSQHSQHSQPRCWSALGLLCHLLIPARILVEPWKSSAVVAGGQVGVPGLQVQGCHHAAGNQGVPNHPF